MRLNLTRYSVLGDLPIQSALEAGIRAHHAVPIDPAGTDERAVGWCQHGDELNLHPDYRYGSCIVLDLRIESLRVPSKELKREVRKLQIAGSTMKSRDLKEVVKADLRKKIPSKIVAIPMLWDVDRKRVYLMSQSPSARESFLLWFAVTFAIQIEMEEPTTPEGAHRAEFLTWLFHLVATEKQTGFAIMLGDKMRLAHGEAEIVIDSDMDQARRAVAEDYTVRELGLHFSVGDRMWTATIDCALQLKGVALPAILGEGTEEETLERAELLAELDGMIQSLYQRYLADRRAAWTNTLYLIKRWASAEKT
jgi:hypothetical protein